MKKITLSLLTVVCAVGAALSQPSVTLSAPPYDGSTSTASGPNGTQGHTFMRAAWLIDKSELTSFIATNSLVTAVGFDFSNGVGTAVSGNFTVYLQNTGDVSYNKGGTFSTILTGMLPHFIGTMSLPVTSNTASVMLPLTSNFTYTGGGIYIAYEWECAGPFTGTATAARYLCNSTGPGSLATVGGVRNFGLTAQTTLTNSAFRPAVNWVAGNSLTNEIDIVEIWAPGKVASLASTQHDIQAFVMNRSGVPLSNVVVSLTATGANPISTTQNITTINAGETKTINFSYTPLTAGATNMTVSIANDQNNSNNKKVWTQSVTCTEWGYNPPIAATSFTSGDFGFNAGSGIILNKFTPSSNLTITDLRLALGTSTANLNKNLFGALLNSSGGLVATTATIQVVSGMPATWVSFNFATPQVLTAGQTYYIGFAIPVSPMFPFASLVSPAASPALTGYYYTSGLTGGVLNPVPGRWFGIEAVIQSTLAPIVLTASPTALCKGETATLTASGSTNASYAWSTGTSTLNVITVTPSLPGTQTQVVVNYNVTGTDLTSQCPLVGSAVSVTVKAVPSLTLAVSPKSTCVGSKATITPAGAASYTANGGALNDATGTTFSIVGTAVGVTTYTIEGTNSLGCSASASIVHTVSACTGLEEAISAGSIRMFPNPATYGVTKITGMQGNNTVTVFNALGQIVITESTNEGTVEIDLTKQANGNYLVKVQGDNGVQILKLINQK